MKTFRNIFILLLTTALLFSCGGPVEEAKDVNEERFEDTALEDDANFAVDFANYLMFSDSLAEIVIARTQDQLLIDFATKVQNDHEQLLSQLKVIADTAMIELPTAIAPEYQEFLEDMLEEDDLAEVKEDYLERVMKLHETFAKKADTKIEQTEFTRFLDFARNVSSQQYVHLQQAQDLLGAKQNS